VRAVRLTALGGPECFHVETLVDPMPEAGEVLVRISHAALNRRDVYIAQGLYPGIELPKTLGSDGAGTVAGLGQGARGPALGSVVVIDPQLGWGVPTGIHSGAGASILGMPRDGTFAEYVVVPAANVFPKPAALSDAEAAAIPLAGLTAYRAAFVRGRLAKDDVVLITGVGGGVQTFVLLYAVHAGARTIVTSTSDEKLAHAKALGADVTINVKTSAAWHKDVRAASDGGPTLTIDSLGGETLARCLEIARPGGRVVIYGGTTGDATIRPYAIFWKHLDVLGTSMGSPQDFAAMLALFESGALRPVIDRVYPMDACADAAQRLLASEQFGKVVLAIA
jgi:NADPH:quinone reductase-like Zn-dependent oxidoreductase